MIKKTPRSLRDAAFFVVVGFSVLIYGMDVAHFPMGCVQPGVREARQNTGADSAQ
jgi:hypothetical protein